MGTSLKDLIEDLASTAPDGTPVVVLAQDYRERTDLAQALSEEASLFGIEVVSFTRLEDAIEQLPRLEAQRDQAALVLIEPHEATAFGPWLDASREALPLFVRFVVVLVLHKDFPAFAKAAPAFMSWAKAIEIPHLTELGFSDLSHADKDRLEKAKIKRHLYAFGVASNPDAPDEPLAARCIRLNDGRKLRDGKLSIQVFIDESQKLPIGMNIQLRGHDPDRKRQCYLRYDLDVVPMGSGQVTHFRAHWHAGDDPDGHDAEEHDPRLPSLILDPIAVLEILFETFFPNGPADLC